MDNNFMIVGSGLEKKVSHLKERLSDIKGEIRSADTKVAGLISLITILSGFVYSKFEAVEDLNYYGDYNFHIAIFFISLVFSIAFCGLVFISRFGGKTIDTQIFFVHIYKKYSEDWQSFSDDFKNLSPEDECNQYSAQVIEVSRIAFFKHSLFRLALYCFMVALALTFYGIWLSVLPDFSLF